MRRHGNQGSRSLATGETTTHQAPISAPWEREGRRKPSSWRAFLVVFILSIQAYYGPLWLIGKGNLWVWLKGLWRTKKVEQWPRSGQGLCDYQGAINGAMPMQKHAKSIRNFNERPAPAMGSLRFRSRGRGVLAWRPPEHHLPGGGVHRTSGEDKGAAQPHSQRPCAA